MPGEGTAEGVLITGLTEDDWQVIDAYEDDFYELRPLTLVDGRQAWSYLTDDATMALTTDWSPGDFGTIHLAGFAGKCADWRRGLPG